MSREKKSLEQESRDLAGLLTNVANLLESFANKLMAASKTATPSTFVSPPASRVQTAVQPAVAESPANIKSGKLGESLTARAESLMARVLDCNIPGPRAKRKVIDIVKALVDGEKVADDDRSYLKDKVDSCKELAPVKLELQTLLGLSENEK